MRKIEFIDIIQGLSKLEHERFLYKTKFETLEESFKSMAQHYHKNNEHARPVPMIFDTLIEGRYVWNFISKKYEKVLRIDDQARNVLINDTGYTEDEMIGLFYFHRFEFN